MSAVASVQGYRHGKRLRSITTGLGKAVIELPRARLIEDGRGRRKGGRLLLDKRLTVEIQPVPFVVSPGFDIAICDVKLANSSAVIRKMKSSGKRLRFRFTASLKRKVGTP